MGTVIVIAFFALLVLGRWRFFTSGTPPADPENRPDLARFAASPEEVGEDRPVSADKPAGVPARER